MRPQPVAQRIPPRDPLYPESDGRPLGETGWHVRSLLLLHEVLRSLLAGRDVYLAVDLFLYYEEGNPRAAKAPDLMVVFGAGDHERGIYKFWEEPIPAVIFEVASNETYKEDLVVKRALYARLGVPEYFLYDPVDKCLKPTLQGFRLEGDAYAPIKPGPDGSLASEQLGARLRAEGVMIRFLDPLTNEPILTYREGAQFMSDRADAEARRARAESRRATESTRRADEAAQRANDEARRTQEMARRVEEESRQANAAEAELARLRAMLAGRESPPA